MINLKKIFLTILFTLVLSGGAFAEELTLNCKFISGEETNERYQSQKKLNNEMDVTLILNTKLKRVLKAPYHYGAKSGMWSDDLSHGKDNWSDTEISWQHFSRLKKDEKIQLFYSAKLNRYSGQMETKKLLRYPNSDDHIGTDSMYQCSKKDKLF
ncbi:hypothetical protein [Candidatus Pelagibacter sp. HIMB1715]|uniref:hypothetical protein n=1 Tax=Candidatus Pelagibacter sp. HIMB1715 TaxID=3413369 RepID=UPI003F85BBD5